MFLAGNIPTKDQVQFGEFWSCLGIFRNATNLQNKNRNRNKGKSLPVATQRPTCRPSPATAPSSCLARPGRQAGARRWHPRAPRNWLPPCFLPSPPCWPGQAPRRRLDPLDMLTHPLPHSLAPLRHGRRSRRRSAIVVASTAVPVLLHRVPKLRHFLLNRSTKPRPAGGLQTTPLSSSSTSSCPDHLRCPACSGSSPTAPSAST